MKTSDDLKMLLKKIDHKGYPAYKDTKGLYKFDEYILDIEHVQGDPFASPSKIKLIVEGKNANIPRNLMDKTYKKIALQDYLLRQFGRRLLKASFTAHGSGKSGLMSVSRCGQEILERSGCEIKEDDGTVIVRMEIGFPANGRTINSGELIKILFSLLPEAVESELLFRNMDKAKIEKIAELAENQNYIRSELKKLDLVAFVADGSVLPRETGVSQKPMKNAVLFKTPESMKVTFELPNGNKLSGMGIKKGVTLIVGGGYHGKSTLLEALERGVYNHIENDGREYVITDETAVKLRAEDGRSITGTDISMFIKNLPNKVDTTCFYTEDASGSTSQAANVVEAIEAGSKTFLIDEDTSATNFMIRDALMQLVVAKDKEPITPYIDRIRELYHQFGISTILVAGSSGAYFKKADTIIQMDEYIAYDITKNAKEQADKFENNDCNEEQVNKAQMPSFHRMMQPNKSFCDDRTKIRVNDVGSVSVNKNTIDMRAVEQLVDSEQLRTLGYICKYVHEKMFNGRITLQEAVERISSEFEKIGFVTVCGKSVPCDLAMPRKQEIFACLNRCRNVKINDRVGQREP